MGAGVPVGCGYRAVDDYGVLAMDRYHIYPLDDLREHVTDGGDCWCHPEIDDELIIHRSLDGREKIETGERLVH